MRLILHQIVVKKRWLGVATGLIIFGTILGVFWDKYFFTPKKTIRIGINAHLAYEYFVLAQKKKFFEKVGLDVELVEFGSWGDVQQAFEWRQIDAMVCSLIDVIVTQHKLEDLDPKVILIPSAPSQNGASFLVVEDAINSIRDLKGKRVGVEVHSWSCFFLMKALKAASMSLSDVRLVPSDPTALHVLFKKGYISGAVCYPKYSYDILSDKSYKALYSSYNCANEVTLNVFAVEKTFLASHFNELKEFVKLWDKLLEFRNENVDESNNIIARHNLVSQDEADKIFSRSIPFNLDDQMNLFRNNKFIIGILEEIEEVLQATNMPKKPISFNSVFDRRLIQEAIKSNVAD